MKIKTWDDADWALGEIARQRRALAAATARRDRAIHEAKEAYSMAAVEPLAEIEQLAAELQRFVVGHEEDLEGRSKALTHGRVGLLLVRTLAVRRVKRAVEWLVDAKKMVYLRVKYELNKEALREAPPEILRACGAKVKERDEFWYEVDGQRVAVED